MKKPIIVLPLLVLYLVSCGNSTSESIPSGDNPSTSIPSSSDTSSSSTPSGPYVEEIDSIQDTSIFHAWNWKMNDIKSRLKLIADAGYESIQISPLQPKVDKANYANQSTKSQWWKLYQPLDFSVATTNENFLGDKNDLISLCEEAKKFDISIIVDIVSNHLSGDKGVYNPQVYNRYPLHTYNGNTDDNSVEATVHGRVGGLPDVDTSLSEVQSKITSMLKEYIDCGIKGFRFDTAKHIETPDDGEFASNYWPNVLGSVTSYAKSTYNVDPYYYGEILYTCGKNRSYDSYKKYMSFTDNVSGSDVITAVKNQTTDKLLEEYPTKADPSNLVLWAESHDTYANDGGETTGIDIDTINRAFVIQNSRKNAASLYLARPSDLYNSTICEVSLKGWRNAEIIASNYFHRIYNNKAEKLSILNNSLVNIRGENNFAGVSLVNVKNASEINLKLDDLVEQSYIDLANGKTYQYKKEGIKISLTNGCALLVPTILDPHIPTPEPTYESNVLIKNADENKNYFAWYWNGQQAGKWKQFDKDLDAIGISINSGFNYIICDANKDVTLENVGWSKIDRQTSDLYFDGNQKIYNYDEIVWKS